MSQPVSVLIVDDEVLYAEQLAMVVEQLGYQVAGIAHGAAEALNLYTPEVKLALLDINLNEERDGIDLALELGKRGLPSVIFITSLADLDVFRRAKEASPFAYLTKPIDKVGVARHIELALHHQQLHQEPETAEMEQNTLFQDSWLIKDRGQITRVPFSDILYLEADAKYSYIHTTQRKYIVRMGITALQAALPDLHEPDVYLQVHRSYVANMRHFKSLDPTDSTITIGTAVLPLGKAYKEKMLAKFKWLV